MNDAPTAAPRPPRSRPHPFRPRDAHRTVREQLGRQDLIALGITRAVGTMWMVYAFALFMAGWMLLQVVLGHQAFDPYPFAFLLFLGNIVQLLLMPLIMVGQNLDSRHAEARAAEEFATVTKTFHDLEAVLAHLDTQDQELLRQTRLLLALVERVVPADERERLMAEQRCQD